MATVYYIDPSISEDLDSTVSGLKYTGLTADAGTDATKIVDAGLNGKVIPHGSYVWNSTRNLGAAVTEWDDGTDTITVAIAGQSSGDTYYLITPFKKVGGFTVKTLTAGDIGYVRAGTTDTLAAAINCTSDGTAAAYLSCIGMGTGSATLETTDGTATEAWHDASTVRPIIDGNNAAYYFNIQTDNYWKVENLDMRNTNSSTFGCLSINTVYGSLISNCVIRDQANSAGPNLYISGLSGGTITGCVIKNSNGMNAIITLTAMTISDTTFDSGALTTTYGIHFVSGILYLYNCVFGGTSTHSTSDIYFEYQNVGKIYTKNCKFNSSVKITYSTVSEKLLFEENAQQVYGANSVTGYNGVLTKTTSVTRSGGADSSIKFVPSTNVGAVNLAALRDFPDPLFRVWGSTTPSTMGLYMRTYSSWATYPTTAGLWLEAEYVSSSSGLTSKVTSTAVLASTETWTLFSCPVAPVVPSFINLTPFMAYASSSGGVYIDIKPIVQ